MKHYYSNKSPSNKIRTQICTIVFTLFKNPSGTFAKMAALHEPLQSALRRLFVNAVGMLVSTSMRGAVKKDTERLVSNLQR